MAKQITIVAGDVNDETIIWLKAHGAQVKGFGLVTITLPEKALVHRGNRGWDYSVDFYNHEGNSESSWLEVELNLDAYETSLRVQYDGDRECSCQGNGCAECVDELAAIARGQNPYAHHLPAGESEADTMASLHIPAGWTRPQYALGTLVYTPGDGQMWEIVAILYQHSRIHGTYVVPASWRYGLLRDRRDQPLWVAEDAVRPTPWQQEPPAEEEATF